MQQNQWSQLWTILAIATPHAYTSGQVGGPGTSVPSNAVIIHSPILDPGTDLYSADPLGHWHFPQEKFVEAAGMDPPHFTTDYIAGEGDTSFASDASPLWGRQSTKFVYVKGTDSKIDDAYYYVAVSSGLHGYEAGSHAADIVQKFDVTLYKRHRDADEWEMVRTHEWSVTPADGYPQSRRAFQQPSLVVQAWNDGKNDHKELHVIFSGFTNVAPGGTDLLPIRDWVFPIDLSTGNISASTTPDEEILDTSVSSSYPEYSVRWGACVESDTQKFIYVAGPEFGDSVDSGIKAQGVRLLRYNPNSTGLLWQVPTAFGGAGYLPKHLTYTVPQPDKPETLDYMAVESRKSVESGETFVWMVGTIFDWDAGAEVGVELITADRNGTNVVDTDPYATTPDNAGDIEVLSSTQYDPREMIDFLVVRRNPEEDDFWIFILVHDQNTANGGDNKIRLFIYDQTGYVDGSGYSRLNPPVYRTEAIVPDASSTGQDASGVLGNLFYDYDNNQLYFLNRQTGGDRELAYWRTDASHQSGEWNNWDGVWDKDSVTVSPPSHVSSWRDDWRRMSYVHTLKPRAGGDIPDDGNIHALVTYELAFWSSSYNDYVYDAPGYQSNPWTYGEERWLLGPGRASWNAVGIWDISLDVLP